MGDGQLGGAKVSGSVALAPMQKRGRVSPGHGYTVGCSGPVDMINWKLLTTCALWIEAYASGSGVEGSRYTTVP